MQLVQPLLFLVLFISCNNAEVVPTNTQDAQEELESKECENHVVKNLPPDNQTGVAQLLSFVNSLDNILIALKTYLAAQDTTSATLNAKIDAQIVKFDAQNSKIDRLTAKISKLTKLAQFNPVTWKDFDDIIATQAKEIKTGNSYNGSTLSDVISWASLFGYNREYTAIVFVNHLGEAIDDFTIHETYITTMYNPAPNSVPGRTQEVFTFANPNDANTPSISFSFAIPGLGVRIAAISYSGTVGTGLAFVPKGTDMRTYYHSHKGIEGSSIYEGCDHNLDRNLSVGYKNFYARMFADNEGANKATLQIELIKFSLDN